MTKSLALRAKVIGYHEAGKTPKQIVDMLGNAVSRPTVFRWLKASREMMRDPNNNDPNNNVPLPKKQRGNRLKVTPANLQTMRRAWSRNPFLAAKVIRSNNASLHHLSVRTVQDAMRKKLGLPCMRAAKKPALTPQQLQKRLQFARQYEDKSEDWWCGVLYSDESTFRLGAKTRPHIFCRRQRGVNRYKARYTIRYVRHNEGLTAWGCFSGAGPGNLVVLPRKAMMNTARYVPVLRDEVVPTMQRDQCHHYLQDNAPCHKSRASMGFLRANNVQVFDWPANSPDINPQVMMMILMMIRMTMMTLITMCRRIRGGS